MASYKGFHQSVQTHGILQRLPPEHLNRWHPKKASTRVFKQMSSYKVSEKTSTHSNRLVSGGSHSRVVNGHPVHHAGTAVLAGDRTLEEAQDLHQCLLIGCRSPSTKPLSHRTSQIDIHIAYHTKAAFTQDQSNRLRITLKQSSHRTSQINIHTAHQTKTIIPQGQSSRHAHCVSD